jgi:hypothetical protein
MALLEVSIRKRTACAFDAVSHSRTESEFVDARTANIATDVDGELHERRRFRRSIRILIGREELSWYRGVRRGGGGQGVTSELSRRGKTENECNSCATDDPPSEIFAVVHETYFTRRAAAV